VIFTGAAIQMRSGTDMARNLAEASAMIAAAKAKGAHFVATPEMTNIIEPDRPRLRALARPEAEDATVAGYSALAKGLGLWLNIGSLALMGAAGRLINRSLLFAPDGSIAVRYDKIHLFDVDLPSGERVRESQAYDAGSSAVVAALPWGGLGMTICYDVRFPVLYRLLAQQGAAIITVPSAFTVATGEAHWHVLLRARAIETGCFVLAAAQGGRHDSGRETFGHSLAVSPWGEVIAEAGAEPGVVMVEIDMGEVARARSRIPSLIHDRPFVLKAPAAVAT
jgi:deaminated glutathione amidase